MSWLNNQSRPKIKTKASETIDVPDNTWQTCKSCGAILYHKEVESNMFVCRKCGYNMIMPVNYRFTMLFDNGKFEKIKLTEIPDDPLNFEDLKKYKNRLAASRKDTNERDVLLSAFGKIGNIPAVVSCFNFKFMGGSMGVAVGQGIIESIDYAIKKNCAFIILPASGGARMQEGILSLMQMARTTVGVDKLSKAKLPYIVIFTNPTYGGVTASFAMLGDIHIAETGAEIGFAGRRVVEQTIKQQLPDDFQTSEYLKTHGMIDVVVKREDLKETLSKILKIFATAKQYK